MMKLSILERTFLYERLLPSVLSPSAKQTWNLKDEFRNHITSTGEGPIRSMEIADKQFSHLKAFLERHLSYWDAQGIPRPLTDTDRDHIFLSWSHSRFLYYSGLSARIDSNFCEMCRYIQSLDPKRFLVACALWLKCVGFNRILICDERGDGGVDLLGLFEEGGLRSLVAVIQAKTSSKPISRGAVASEYDKYQQLRGRARYLSYCRALDVNGRADGASWSYMVFTNHAFEIEARNVSRDLGILLRSVYQTSFILAEKYSKSVVEQEVDRLVHLADPDLSSNFCVQISI